MSDPAAAVLWIILGAAVGAALGLAFYAILIRPRQLDYWERRRREAGLPSRRHLREDDD